MTMLLSDKTYNETRDIKLGRTALSREYSRLADWVFEKHGVNMLNAEFGFLKEAGQYRLYVIVDSTEDFKKISPADMYCDSELRRTRIAEFAAKLVELKIAGRDKVKKFFVAFNDFSMEAKVAANWKAEHEVKTLLAGKYSGIWRVEVEFSAATIFFHTDAEVKGNEANGTSANMLADYYSTLKKYDEMGYFSREDFKIEFSSKENLDKNYEGNLFYWSRR